MADPILARLIADRAARQPDLDVLTFVDLNDSGSVEERRSYADLWRNGQRVAAALQREAMAPGDTFALVMQNHPEFVDAMVGASIAGAVFVPLDPRTDAHRMAQMFRLAGCRGVVVADYSQQTLHAALALGTAVEWVWVLDTGAGESAAAGCRLRRFADVLADSGPDSALVHDDAAATMQLLFTSGTTGPPKAIVSTHARFAGVAGMGELLGFQASDRPYTGLSLTHANAQFITLGNALHMGMRAVISRRFTRSRLWDVTRRYGCTVFNLLGGMTTALLAEPERPDDARNPVRYVLSAGMPLAAWHTFAARFDVQIFEFYGTAEGGMLLNPPRVGPAGSVGRPPEGIECVVLGKDDVECAPGELGELCFRNAVGAALDVAYFRDPEASAAKTRGGWLRTGDVGHRDADGWLYFNFRLGDGIRRNGEFIDPARVEQLVAGVPGVADVHVYGIALPQCAPGEKELVAAVEPADGFDPGRVFAACERGLPGNWVPGHIQVVATIPKTASEKPLARQLRDAFGTESSTLVARSRT
ncbi:MAG: AMP-binding protein [Pseudomonadales bacterium]